MKITIHFYFVLLFLSLVGCTGGDGTGSIEETAAVADTSTATEASTEQFRDYGDYNIHFIAFTTDILSADVAKTYQITRSKNRALVNISVLKKVMGTTGTPSLATVTGTATNLSSQLREMEFKEVREQGAVYYLAEVSVNHGETFKFDMDITPEGHDETYKLSFSEQFVTDY
jgi:hypothetical protein